MGGELHTVFQCYAHMTIHISDLDQRNLICTTQLQIESMQRLQVHMHCLTCHKFKYCLSWKVAIAIEQLHASLSMLHNYFETGNLLHQLSMTCRQHIDG